MSRFARVRLGFRGASMVALLAGAAVHAQAPETQSQTSPAPAEDRAADQAGTANNPGPGTTRSRRKSCATASAKRIAARR